MDLDTIIEKAQIVGYYFEKGSKESTIKTKRGEVDVIVNEGRGQPHCYIGRHQIQLFTDNENLVGDLVHERDHFQIFPYDLILTGTVIAGTLAYLAINLYQTNDWKYATASLTMMLGTITVLGGLNLVADGIIYAREIFGLNRR